VTHRIYNFNAGPAALPLPVLEKIRDELLDYRGSGMSILEVLAWEPNFVSCLCRVGRASSSV